MNFILTIPGGVDDNLADYPAELLKCWAEHCECDIEDLDKPKALALALRLKEIEMKCRAYLPYGMPNALPQSKRWRKDDVLAWCLFLQCKGASPKKTREQLTKLLKECDTGGHGDVWCSWPANLPSPVQATKTAQLEGSSGEDAMAGPGDTAAVDSSAIDLVSSGSAAIDTTTAPASAASAAAAAAAAAAKAAVATTGAECTTRGNLMIGAPQLQQLLAEATETGRLNGLKESELKESERSKGMPCTTSAIDKRTEEFLRRRTAAGSGGSPQGTDCDGFETAEFCLHRDTSKRNR